MRLHVHDADPERVERIRVRCLDGLAARRRRHGATRRSPGGWRAWFEPAVAVGLGMLYLAEAVVRALAAVR